MFGWNRWYDTDASFPKRRFAFFLDVCYVRTRITREAAPFSLQAIVCGKVARTPSLECYNSISRNFG